MCLLKSCFYFFPLSVLSSVCPVRHFSTGKTTSRPPPSFLSNNGIRAQGFVKTACGRKHLISLFFPLCACYFSKTSTEVISSTRFCMNILRANFFWEKKNRPLVKGRNREDSLFLVYRREDLHIKTCIWFFRCLLT